jgi:hypothetical protein
MSKFVRVDKAEDPKKGQDTQSRPCRHGRVIPSAKRHEFPRAARVFVSFYSAERMTLAALYFDSIGEGNRWALQHLGVDL